MEGWSDKLSKEGWLYSQKKAEEAEIRKKSILGVSNFLLF
jgi:hypothetical protein